MEVQGCLDQSKGLGPPTLSQAPLSELRGGSQDVSLSFAFKNLSAVDQEASQDKYDSVLKIHTEGRIGWGRKGKSDGV